MQARNRISRIILALSLTLLAAGPAAAQTRGSYRDVPGFPDGLVGEHLRGLLAVFESGDPDAAWTFVAERFSPGFRDAHPKEAHLGFFAEVYDGSRGFDLHGIRKYDEGNRPGETVAIVRNRLTGAWEAIVIVTEPDPPHRIAGLSSSPARPPSDLPPPARLAMDRLGPELAAFAERLHAADVFSGTFLLAKDGRILAKGAVGQASKRFDVPNRIDTKFNLGSMNKMFTAVAVVQLVEKGKLALDDPISKHLDAEWLPAVDKDKVRIAHLLTHTSGLGSYFNQRYMESSRQLFRQVDDYKPLVEEETLAFEPGTDRRYSNTGMLILGAVIESASGQDYFDYVREHIYKPAGMVHSDSYDMDHPVPNLAIGYSRQPDGTWTNNLYRHVIRGGPAGGGFSTVEDLLRFDRALRSGVLVSREMAEELWSPRPEVNSPEYGYGFRLANGPAGRVVGHGGGFAGISANLDMFLDAGYCAVVLSNYDRGSRAMREKMRELIARADEG